MGFFLLLLAILGVSGETDEGSVVVVVDCQSKDQHGLLPNWQPVGVLSYISVKTGT